MHASSHGSTQSGSGPAMFLGYCHQSRRYRMMDFRDYVSNVQEGMTRLMSDPMSAMRGYADAGAGARQSRECGCGDCNCHCECCVCDADVLVHARCGEIRRIPITFENDTRREREVKLELGNFVTAGGRDIGWPAQLSETEFTLRSCDEHTVTLAVRIDCREQAKEPVRTETDPNQPNAANQPNANQPNAANQPNVRDTPQSIDVRGIRVDRVGSVDRCEVGYATIRATGCLTRPVVVAVAVLPDDCDAYRHPCGCGCCH